MDVMVFSKLQLSGPYLGEWKGGCGRKLLLASVAVTQSPHGLRLLDRLPLSWGHCCMWRTGRALHKCRLSGQLPFSTWSAHRVPTPVCSCRAVTASGKEFFLLGTCHAVGPWGGTCLEGTIFFRFYTSAD